MRRPEVLQMLQDARRDPNPDVRQAARAALARLDCNIEVALIDTEGQKAIDVFYLTSRGKKLDAQKREVLREVLQGTIG